MGTISVSLPADGTTANVADINTPINTIVNEINGNIDNNNIKSGAAIDGSKLADTSVPIPKLSNPYTFRAYAASNQTGVGSATWTVVALGTESYDANNNFASNTYTAPITGLYHFDASVNTTASTGLYTGMGIRLVKNGSDISGSPYDFDNNVSYDLLYKSFSDTIQLTAGDTIALHAILQLTSGTGGFAAGQGTRLAGYLVCPG